MIYAKLVELLQTCGLSMSLTWVPEHGDTDDEWVVWLSFPHDPGQGAFVGRGPDFADAIREAVAVYDVNEKALEGQKNDEASLLFAQLKQRDAEIAQLLARIEDLLSR
jgi:hypothetical protein